MGLFKLAAELNNEIHTAVASEPVVFYGHDGTRLTDEIIYDIDGNLTTSPLMAVLSTLQDDPAEMVFDGKTDDRKVDFLVSVADMPSLPVDGDYIVFESVKYTCFSKDGEKSRTYRYSDQFNQRLRIHTRRNI